MTISAQIAKHLRAVYFGGNWTVSNLKDAIADVNWQQATAKVETFNTIATLVYHVNYFVVAATKVLQGENLNAKDALSFNHPPINCEDDWQQFLQSVWKDAELFANFVEKLPDKKLSEIFSEEKYGTYYRNLNGIIEHLHYHLGQIVIIKKIIFGKDSEK